MKIAGKELEAILFDMDGTLLDTIPCIVEAYQYTFKKHLKEEIPYADILSMIGRPLEDYFQQVQAEKWQEMLVTYLEYSDMILTSRVGIFIGIIEMLEELRNKGIKMGIVTSKRKSQTMISLEQFELAGYFDLILVKEDTVIHKPKPEPLWQAAEKFKISDYQKVLYVGDSIHDIKASKAAGMLTALVDWTYMDKAELKAENPEIWLSKPQELGSLLS